MLSSSRWRGVRISRGFWMGKDEAAQGQWEAVTDGNRSRFDRCGPDRPVEDVTWESVQEFIGRLHAGAGEVRYRPPTEEVWEYAARTGTSCESHSDNFDEIAGFGSRSS